MKIVYKKDCLELESTKNGAYLEAEYLDPCEGWQGAGVDLSFDDLRELRDAIDELLNKKEN